MSKLIDFTNLLHKHGSPAAPEVQAFLSQNADDEMFQARAQAVLMGFAAAASEEAEAAVAAPDRLVSAGP
jgi:hypothetical protein